MRAIYLLLLIFVSLAAHSQKVFAAEIVRATRVAVIIKFDPFEENFAVGDKLVARKDGKKFGLIEIRKIKGEKILGRILAGKVAPGMSIQKNDSVSGGKKEKPSDVITETVTIKMIANYVTRGIAYRRPHIQGSVDFTDSNLLGGLVIMSSDLPSSSEADVYLGYAFNHLDFSIIPSINRYMFPGTGYFDTWDLWLTVATRIVSLDLSYRPDSFGTKTSESYIRLTSEFEFRPKWKVNTHIGYSMFSKESNVGYRNYLSYQLGLIYYTNDFTVEFAYSDTDRQSTGANKITDSNASLTISKKF